MKALKFKTNKTCAAFIDANAFNMIGNLCPNLNNTYCVDCLLEQLCNKGYVLDLKCYSPLIK